MSVTTNENSLRLASYTIDADGTVGPIDLHDHTDVSYQIAPQNTPDGMVSVKVTNDPNQNDWVEGATPTPSASPSCPTPSMP